MSNTRRVHRANGHRHGRAAHNPDEEVGVVVGWSDNDHVEMGKQQTHDTLIELMGPARTGGVTWRIVKGAERALPVLERLREGADAAHLALYDQLAALLTDHDGVLIIATAPGRPGWQLLRPPPPPESGDIGGQPTSHNER